MHVQLDEVAAPVVRRSDVVVVGGGPAGVSAAVAAARMAARTARSGASSSTWRRIAARRVGCRKRSVGKANVSARRCYERCGFKEYGVEPEAVFVDGSYYDEALMFVRLLA